MVETKDEEKVITDGELPAEVYKQMDKIMEEGSDSMSVDQKLGVMQRLVTAVAKDEEYLQVLLNAAFENKYEAMLAADAISERQRYGVNIRPLVNRIVAQCSVAGDRVNKLLEALTHYTFHTNYPTKKPFWKRQQDDKSLG